MFSLSYRYNLHTYLDVNSAPLVGYFIDKVLFINHKGDKHKGYHMLKTYVLRLFLKTIEFVNDEIP